MARGFPKSKRMSGLNCLMACSMMVWVFSRYGVSSRPWVYKSSS